MTAYYNEIDAFAAQWLRNLIANGLIAAGEVDERSIIDVRPDDLRGFTQCHFFAGIGGWSHALRLAGWPEDRPIWTGSCPCQPFSVAGKGLGTDDPRHLWPYFHRLIAAVRPPVVMGEQVAGAAGYGWLDGVRADLEREDYACRGVDIPACAVDAPHIRQRLYWVATVLGYSNGSYGQGGGLSGGVHSQYDNTYCGSLHGNLADPMRFGRQGQRAVGEPSNTAQSGTWEAGHALDACAGPDATSDMADADSSDIQARGSDGLGTGPEGSRDGSVARCRDDDDPRHMADADEPCASEEREQRGGQQCGTGGDQEARLSFWSNAIWLTGADGKARRAEPSIPLLANGIPGRVGRLRAYGNAIVPPLAAEVIKAFMECEP